jgi:DNA-directed RNA polymerase subunit RPC12/RpoP
MKLKNKDKLNIYECEECGNKKEFFPKSRAYDCPFCGIVIGYPLVQHFRSSEDSWSALAGREGEHYYCIICGSQLGSNYWKMS